MRGLYCLLGDPVAHSRSPALMTRAFAALSVDAVYAPCRVEAAELPQAFAGLRALGARGFNVTVPHKAAALALCDRVVETAGRIGAVNCVVREEGAWVGHNTDAPGLLRALRQAGVDAAGPGAARVAIVGAGGSARAAAMALAPHAGHLAVLNRSAAAAQTLAGLLRDAGARAEAAVLGSAEAQGLLAQATLVVHCTTVGMGSAAVAFEVAKLRADAVVVDLVYAGPRGSAPGETALLEAARGRKLRAVDGIDVLVHQAIASLEIWLGRPGLHTLAGSLREAASAQVTS
ncbi:MAG: shikimate dehydrogenase [Myxococcales bacterium]